MRSKLRLLVLIIVGLFVLLQLFPVERTNPPITQEIAWDSPETEAIARRACYDCHSNETVWPWYAYVAPASILVARDTDHGREHLNFSEWDSPNEGTNEIIESVVEGEMPLPIYLPLHPEASLSDAEKELFVSGLRATLANDPPIEHEH